MADEKSQSSSKPSGAGAAARAPEPSLGQFLTEARKARGFTAEQLIATTGIPAHYVRAIETDDYAMVADELYLLPFLRRYSSYLGLDPEDIASRFVRDVQRAENNPSARIAEPISMVTSTRERKPARGRSLATGLLLAAIAILAAALYLRRDSLLYGFHPLLGGAAASPVASPTPSAPQAQSSAVPFKTAITPESPAAPPPISSPANSGNSVN
ncbi:MAG TPA: helix-turn-helix transcriptional regulator [Candidatus Binataceae bacterium]|nr:helix-turn-helix transcriptional regulator [Candidatus Binataceae bacterium]